MTISDLAELSASDLAEIEADEAAQRADRKLLADTLRWARVNGHVRTREYEDGGRFSGYSWTGVYPDVLWNPDAGDGTLYCGTGMLSPETAREAVDVLCALGALPAELSSIFTAGRESLQREPNDIEATGGCCCNGCIGQGLCDLYDPCDADERAENDAERIAEMSDDEQERCGEL
jgi:hypothetical protein